MHKKGGRLK